MNIQINSLSFITIKSYSCLKITVLNAGSVYSLKKFQANIAKEHEDAKKETGLGE